MLICKRKCTILLGKLKNPLQILVFILFRTIQAQYFFKNAEDQQICEQVEFVEISPYRGVSMTQMSWQSAHACCKMKGRLLHTIEKSVESEEYLLQKSLPDKLGKESEELQFWIGLSLHKGKFQWSFGSLLQKFSEKVIHETYRWVDGHPEITAGDCVAISPFKAIIEMRTAHCNTKLNFICQKISRSGGEPLSGQDMMEAGSAEFMKIPGFDNLKFSKTYTRWPVANAICQSRNWALIDRVHERYGDKLAEIIRQSKYMFNSSSRVIHTGGNDFCEFHKWQWTCGEKLEGTIPWSLSTTLRTPDKSENKRCLQYTVKTVNSTFLTNIVSCNEFGYTICDTTPSCSVGDQYRCLYKDPHFVDLEAEAKDEQNYCRTTKFQSWNDTQNGNTTTTLWMSPSKFTWLGANACCKSRGWDPVAPRSHKELESLQQITLEAIISLCDDETKCDGFWTSTSTRGYLPHSPLRFPDGKMLSRNLYSSVRADGFSFPSCGRINYIDLQKFQSNYVLADCLEKNFIVCEEIVKQEHTIMPRKAMDILEKGLDEFHRDVYAKFFVQPTEEEKGRRSVDYKRDYCPSADIEEKYTGNCPDSATKINPDVELEDKTKHPHFVKAKVAVPFQNKKMLLDQLVAHAFYSSNDTADYQAYGYQFLNTSAYLFMELCPLVPPSFITLALKLFIKLHHILNPERRPEIVTKVHFDWAMKMLQQCDEYLKPVNIKHDNCGDLIMAEKTCDNFVCTDSKFEFNMHNADVLVDVIWKVFESIHAACFPAFKKNVLMHHKYAYVIADLWESDGIRTRWAHQLATKKFWKRLLGPFVELHALNIERCNKATIENSYFHVRLPRHTVPHSVRMTGFSYGKLRGENETEPTEIPVTATKPAAPPQPKGAVGRQAAITVSNNTGNKTLSKSATGRQATVQASNNTGAINQQEKKPKVMRPKD